MRFKELPVDRVVSAGNVRSEEDEQLGDLMESIERHGVLQPVLVRQLGKDRYELISGHRRFAAVKALNEPYIPAMITTEVTDHSRTIVQLVENAQRKQLSAVEYVEVFNAMRAADRSLTHAKIGRLIGKSSSWVANQYSAATLAGALVSEGVVSGDRAKAMTSGQIVHQAHSRGITTKGMRKTSDISVACINSTTINVRCRDAAVVARVLEVLDGVRAEIRREAS